MNDRQYISVQIGQCGIQMGNSMWELYCLEHSITPDGFRSPCDDKNLMIDAFFYEKSKDRFVPRCVLADLEPTVLDKVRSSSYKGLYDPTGMVSGIEDGASNFGRGFYTVGKDKLESTMEAVRRVSEQASNIEGLFLFHSCGGGTGSGFGALIMNSLLDEHPKKDKMEFVVYPGKQVSSSVVEPYNAVLSFHRTEGLDCTFCIDNESLYNISQKKLNTFRPTYVTLNGICAQAISSITTSLRFEGYINLDLSMFKLNLIPFPRLRFPVITYAPFTTVEKVLHEDTSVKKLTYEVFEPNNQFVNCDLRKGKFMACFFLYRGDVVLSDIRKAIQVIKNQKNIRFVEWCPTGIKIGVNPQKPKPFPNEMSAVGRSVCMLANTTASREMWKRVGKKFDLMFKERAFTHWYLREGVEEHEFIEARKDLEMIKNSYKEIEVESGTSFLEVPNEI